MQTLSGGQKQRVAIAGSLAEACKVLLLDELTTFLDEKDQVFYLILVLFDQKNLNYHSNQYLIVLLIFFKNRLELLRQ